MAYDNNMTGALFKNEKTKDTQPDYKGTAQIAGKTYWVSGWIKVAGPNAKVPGSKFMSLALEEKAEFAPTPVRTPSPAMDYDDTLPF